MEQNGDAIAGVPMIYSRHQSQLSPKDASRNVCIQVSNITSGSKTEIQI